MLKMNFVLSLLLAALISNHAWSGETGILAPPEAHVEILRHYDRLVRGREGVQELTALNSAQRRRLLELVQQNEVASFAQIRLYDPPQNGSPQGEIGYCYGRAMAAHLIARRMGLAESAIHKIFAAGDMQNGNVRWRFHVATVVRGEDGQFYAIDPIVPHDPLPIEAWIEEIRRRYDNTERILVNHPELAQDPRFTGTIQFYLSPNEAIMVDMREIPADLSLESGERIIEILFETLRKPGFAPVYKAGVTHPTYFVVESEEAMERYFMTAHEAEADRFNFFRMDAKILYLQAGSPQVLERHYLYNGKQEGALDFQPYDLGYFPSLLRSVDRMAERFQ